LVQVWFTCIVIASCCIWAEGVKHSVSRTIFHK